jgi:hypothetical protein
MDKLSEALAQFLEGAIGAGFKLPFCAVAVAANCTMTAVKYTPANGENADDGLDALFIANHEEGPGFALPINVMLTDSTGQAARMLIEGPEPEFFWPESLPSE